MKKIILCAMLLLPRLAHAQNVGIGTTVVDKARLTVIGTANINSNTVAFFGANAGISLQQAWPTIGFNQYRAIPTGNGYAITTGYGMHMTFNYTNGDFAMLRNGNAATNQPLPLQQSFFTFINSANSLRLNNEIPDGRVDVANKLFAAQSGNFNLVPLGVINLNLFYTTQNGFTVVASNTAGNLMFDYSTEGVGNTMRTYLYLSNAVIAGYSSLIVVPAMTYGNPNGGSIMDLISRVEGSDQKHIHFGVRVTALGTQAFAQGHLLVYGVD
jgi:hypothetical protein